MEEDETLMEDGGAVLYFKNKLDDQLEHFNDLIRHEQSIVIIENNYNSLLRIRKQLKMMEDLLIIETLIKNKTQI